MRWPDAAGAVMGALVGAYFGPWAWFGVTEPSFEGIWIGIWLGSSAAVLLLLLLTRRRRSLQTAAWHLPLSLVALSFVAGFSRSLQIYGPWVEDSLISTGLALVVAALAARYLATRSGSIAVGAWGCAGLAIAGLAIGGVIGYVAAAGFAGVMSDIVPCAGFECGVGTFLAVWVIALPLFALLGSVVALAAARGSMEHVS